MLPVAIGSDGGGSTRLPAANSGVVGMHPTGGLIPELDYAKPRPPAGITVGTLARSVRDAGLVTQVMAGPDGREPFSIQTEADDFLAAIDKVAKGGRYGWSDVLGCANVHAATHWARAV